MKKKYQTSAFSQILDEPLASRERPAEPSETGRDQQQEINFHYYQEYKRLYVTAYYLAVQMRQLLNKKEDLWERLSQLQRKIDFSDNIRGQQVEKKKRVRRTEQQIEKKYICQVQICQKSYGTEGSLQQHIKLKHPELYQPKSYVNPHSNSL